MSGLGEEEALRLRATAHLNCAVCLQRLGRHDESIAGCERARGAYDHLGDRIGVARVLTNRGVVLLSLGQGSAAPRDFNDSVEIYEDAGQPHWQADALINVGDAHLLLGNYSLSLQAFEAAAELRRRDESAAEEPVLLLDTADANLALNLYPEALAAYRNAEQQLRSCGARHHRARALWGLDATLAALARYEEAQDVLSEAEELLARSANEPLRAEVVLEQAALLAALGSPDDALLRAEQALAQVEGKNWPLQELWAHLRLADLLQADSEKAERHLTAARALAESRELPPVRFRLDQRLGHLRLKQGRLEEARQFLESAVHQIEGTRGTLAHEAVRMSFLKDKAAAFEDLVQLHLTREGRDDDRQAFGVAERAKSRTLVEMLAGLSVAEVAEPENRAVNQRLEAARTDLSAIYSEWLSNSGESGRTLSVADLESRAVELEQEISLLQLRAATVQRRVSPFGVTRSTRGIQADLAADEALVAYHIIDDEIVAFVCTRYSLQVVQGIGRASTAKQLLQRLSAQWDRFRAGPEFVERNMDTLVRSAVRLLGLLYEEVFAPLEPALAEFAPVCAGARSPKLVVVPHGLLHQLPFHALWDGERYLLERYEVVCAPSATVWSLCQRLDDFTPRPALAVGVTDEQIPAAREEAYAVSRQLEGWTVLVDEEATSARIRVSAPRCGVLHLACHGLFRADNPMFSSLKLGDGWLTAGDVMQMQLPRAFVALSACESGRNQAIGGDEVLGLSRAFLGAGAATVLVSLWLVHDEAAADLMTTMYGRVGQGQSWAAALRGSQLALKEQRPHPYYWAPFVLIGHR